MDMHETPEFIESLRQGDKMAFKTLVEKYQPMVTAIGMQIINREEDIEDFAQEVFLKVHASISSFKGRSSLSTWIYRIAVNQAFNIIRKSKWRNWITSWNRVQITEANLPKNQLNSTDQDYQEFEKKELRKILNLALRQLPEKQRIAFMLTRIEGISYREVAEIIETTESAVDSLTQRAKVHLRKILASYYKSYE